MILPFWHDKLQSIYDTASGNDAEKIAAVLRRSDISYQTKVDWLGSKFERKGYVGIIQTHQGPMRIQIWPTSGPMNKSPQFGLPDIIPGRKRD